MIESNIQRNLHNSEKYISSFTSDWIFALYYVAMQLQEEIKDGIRIGWERPNLHKNLHKQLNNVATISSIQYLFHTLFILFFYFQINILSSRVFLYFTYLLLTVLIFKCTVLIIFCKNSTETRYTILNSLRFKMKFSTSYLFPFST